MMLYKVQAKMREGKMEAFFTALTDGSIATQEPDGTTIVNAMQKALMIDDETLAWYEVCHCATPLAHERETVYDAYLYDIETTLVYKVQADIVGKSFWDYLESIYYDEGYSY